MTCLVFAGLLMLVTWLPNRQEASLAGSMDGSGAGTGIGTGNAVGDGTSSSDDASGDKESRGHSLILRRLSTLARSGGSESGCRTRC